MFAYQCPTQHISSQNPCLAARNRSTWLLHPNLEGTEITPDFQGVSCCLVICTCVKFVRHNSSRNSVLVLGRLFCFIFFGFAQVSLTLVKLKDGEQRRLWSTSAAHCQTPNVLTVSTPNHCAHPLAHAVGWLQGTVPPCRPEHSPAAPSAQQQEGKPSNCVPPEGCDGSLICSMDQTLTNKIQNVHTLRKRREAGRLHRTSFALLATKTL